MKRPKQTRVNRILAAQERVMLALDQLSNLSCDDPRFPAALSEYGGALGARYAAEHDESEP